MPHLYLAPSEAAAQYFVYKYGAPTATVRNRRGPETEEEPDEPDEDGFDPGDDD